MKHFLALCLIFQKNGNLFFLSGLLCSLSFSLFAQTQSYTGQIKDGQNRESLVFVSVQLKGTTAGTFTDLDGFFTLQAAPGDVLLFSYVGYEDLEITLRQASSLHIEMVSTGVVLQEVIVRPEENPAWRIIREAIAQRKRHDPGQLDGYSYQAYHKTVLGLDTLVNTAAVPSGKRKKPVSLRRLRRDSIRQAAIKIQQRRQELFENEMHLWVTETRSEHSYRSPNQHKETILATQSSMPNDFTGGINPINFQPFGFYQPVIRMEITDQNYVNPLSKGTFQHYDFLLADTIVHAHDTTFVIRFQPLKNKFFTSLKGLLYINTDGYAIENVIAEPADTQQTLQFVIQQQSKRVDGRWFPEKLHVDLFFRVGTGDLYVRYDFRNRSILNDIELHTPAASAFNHYLKESTTTTSVLPDSLRLLPLSEREANTYRYWDSLPELRPAYRFIKAYNGLIKVVSSGLWTGKALDLVVPDLLQANAFEGTRPGLGLKTSPNLSKHFSLYGYAGYGINDQNWKFGGALEAKIYSQRDLRIRLSYSDDLSAPGSIEYLSAVNNPWANWSARNLILERLDKRSFWRGDLIYRPKGAWQLNAFWLSEQRQPLYDYSFGESPFGGLSYYEVQNRGLRIRWAPKERLIKMDQLEAILYPAYPIVDITIEVLSLKEYSQNVPRLSIRLQHEQRWKYLGMTTINLQAGWMKEALPYPYIFQAPGNRDNSLGGTGVFNTAGVTEFAQTEFAFLFLTHRFGPLLGKMKTPYFRPELRLMQQLGWGRSKQNSLHQHLHSKDMHHGFMESGVGLDNVLRIPYFKMVYIGLGGSLWYRWGAYQLPNQRDNFRFQLTVNFSV